MIITKKAIPRRTILRGIGSTIALPLLDGMVPAFAAVRNTAARSPLRLGIMYVPNGMAMASWTPNAMGRMTELPPTLAPLTPFQQRLTVLSGLNAVPSNAGVHASASTRFLTGVTPTRTESNPNASMSMDQYIAREQVKHTQLGSLELALDSRDVSGSCDIGFSCTYTNTIAWRSETTPLPMENNPRAVFERLFGDSGTTDPTARLARIRRNRSVLDSVTEKVADLKRSVGPTDQTKIGEFLEAVRDVERRIEMAETQTGRALPKLEQPPGVPESYEEHAKLMFDLQLLAYQTDLTRIVTFMLGRELTGRTYPEIGVPDAHHPTSHHRGDPGLIAKIAKINRFHVSLFSHFLQKLEATPDGDGSLLDQTVFLYGAGMSDSNLHDPTRLPLLLVNGSTRHKGARHVVVAKDTPVTNLHLTLLDKFGVRLDHLVNSTGKIDLLADV